MAVAATWAEVWDIETQVLEAARLIAADHLPSGVQVVMGQDATSIAVPCCIITYAHDGEYGADRLAIQHASGAVAALPVHFKGTLSVELRNLRPNPSTAQTPTLGTMRGSVRSMMFHWQPIWNDSSRLSHCQIEGVKDLGASHSIDAENNLDIWVSRFELEITVKSAELPALVWQ